MTIDNSAIFHKKFDYESRKDLIIHYLKVLCDSNKPITFSELLLDNLPGGGIDEFESIMTELENLKWIIKTEQDGGPVDHLPFHRKVDRRYSISLSGVEYLASIGIIDEKHKNNNTKKIHQSSSSDLPNHRFNNSSIDRQPIIANVQPNATSIIKSNSPLKNIIEKVYKLTDHKLISGIILLILGVFIVRILTWLNLV